MISRVILSSNSPRVIRPIKFITSPLRFMNLVKKTLIPYIYNASIKDLSKILWEDLWIKKITRRTGF